MGYPKWWHMKSVQQQRQPAFHPHTVDPNVQHLIESGTIVNTGIDAAGAATGSLADVYASTYGGGATDGSSGLIAIPVSPSQGGGSSLVGIVVIAALVFGGYLVYKKVRHA